MIKDRADFARQLFQSERLLQKIVFDIDNVMVQYGLTSVARDEQNSSFRAQYFQFPGQFAATHVRHHHVSDSQVDRQPVIRGDGQGIQAVPRLQHAVSTQAEKFGRRPPQRLLILDQQNSLGAAQHGLRT